MSALTHTPSQPELTPSHLFSRSSCLARWSMPARLIAALIVLLILVGAGATTLHASVPPPVDPERGAEPSAQAAPAAVDTLADNLLAYWKLDQNANDSSGHGRNGTMSSSGYSFILNVGAPTVFANGQSIRFWGASTGGWITVTAGMPLANNSFTLAAWAKRSSDGDAHWIFGQGKNSTRQGLHFGFRDSNQFTCAFYSDDLDAPTIYSDLDTWHHWVCTFDATSKLRRIYRDGVLVAEDTAGAAYTGSGDFWIGRAFQSNERFHGYVDDARVYSVVLSAADVAALGNMDRRPVGFWKFDSNLNDSSANGSAGTWQGGGSATYSTNKAPTADATTSSKALSLDGSHYVSVANSGELVFEDAVSAAVWVRLDGTSDDQKIVGKTDNDDGGIDRGWVLGVQDGNLYCETFGGDDKDVKLGTVPIGEWVHLACTWSRAGSLVGYINGLQVGATESDHTSFLADTDRSLYIGVAPWNTGKHRVTGLIDEVRVYNRQLSPEEIRGLAGDGNPQAYWRFDPLAQRGAGISASDADSSGRGLLAVRVVPVGATASIDSANAAPTPSYANPGSLYLAGGGYEYAALNVSETNYAVSFWFRTTCSNCGLFSVVDDGGGSHDRHIYLSGGKLCARVNSETICTDNKSDFNNGSWHHVAHTFGGSVGGQALYGDGVLGKQGSAMSSTFTWQTRVRIGFSVDGGTDYLTPGSIDDLRIFDRGLHQAEVSALYAGKRFACYGKTNDGREGTDGTIYATLDGAAVQASVDLLGAVGGTVDLAGTCAGAVTRSSTTQVARITPPSYTEGAITFRGDWNPTFSAQSTSTPTVLDGWGQGRVLYAPAGSYGTLSVARLTLRNGFVGGSGLGGGLYTDLPTTLTTSTVASSKAGNSGGGIYASGNLTIDASTVRDNSVTGASPAAGGGIYAVGNLTVTDSTVSGNSAPNGGGINVNSPGKTATLTRVTVKDNRATNTLGGGLAVYEALVMENSTVSGNTSPTRGGGLYVAQTGYTFSIKNSTFSGNRSGSGGGLHNLNGTLDLTDVTVTDNEAATGSGVMAGAGTTKITTSIVAGNRTGASTYGADVGVSAGATMQSGGANVLGFGDRAAFNQNYDQLGVSDPGLGPLQANEGTTYSHLPKADSVAIDAGLCTLTTDQRGKSRAGTGSTYCDAGAVEVQGVTPNCLAKAGSGLERSSVNGRAFQEALDEAAGAAPTVQVGGVCKGTWYNTSTVQTAKITKTITITGSDKATFHNVTPSGRAVIDGRGAGRVLMVTGGPSTASNLELTNGAVADDGAGLWNGASLTLNGAYIHHNIASTSSGGGIANLGSLNLNSSDVSYNSASHGGGIYDGSGNTLVIRDTTVFSNTANTQGGGIFAQGVGVDLQGVTLASNKSQQGGGLFTVEAGATLVNVTVSGNEATDKGGGILSAGVGGKIVHSTITANSAPKGAGLASDTETGSLQVGNTIIAGNFNGDDLERTGGGADHLQSLGYNLIGRITTTDKFGQNYDQVWVTEPGLLGLADNHGPTKTHALMAQPGSESPAIDAGSCSLGGSAPAADQRGSTYLRPGAGSTICDIGAFEAQSVDARCVAKTGAHEEKSVTGRAVQAAIDEAAGGAVDITSGPCKGAWRSGGEYQLVRTAANVTLTTSAASATLDAQGKGRVLTVAGGTTSVTGPNLTLKNGLEGSGGGVKVQTGATAVISGTTISGNTAAVGGGGLAATGVLTVTNSTVRENTNTAQVLAWNTQTTGRFQDSSSLKNHGWCYGAGTVCPVAATVDGYPGLKFSGGGPVRVPNNESLNLTASMTLAAWVYIPTPSGNQKLFGKVQDTGGVKKGYLIGVYQNGIDAEIWDATGHGYHLYPVGAVPANKWTHLAVTYRSGGNLTVYINGSMPSGGQTSVSTAGLGTGTSDFIVGAGPWDTSQYRLTGTLRSIRVFDRELSAGEILSLKDGTLDEASLVGGGEGGGLFVGTGAKVMVDSSAVISNTAGGGGGIFQLDGSLKARNVTLSNNTGLWSGGGVWHAGGTGDLKFVTITRNKTTANTGPKVANLHNSAANLTLMATIISEPLGGSGRTNCLNSAAGAVDSLGYNRSSDASCADAGLTYGLKHLTDANNKPVPLGQLDYNGGPTPTHKLLPDANAVDIMSKIDCESQFPGTALDQRLRARPRVGIRVQDQPLPDQKDWKCDAGAFELGIEKHRVCGSPLLVRMNGATPVWADGAANLCDVTSIAAALAESQPEDTIVVSGVITETVTVDKNVTIRGPSEERTPAWHMGVVQANLGLPHGYHNLPPIFTIPAGVTATIQDLNLRNGDANQGGAILNQGTLTVTQTTLYDNYAADGAAIYSTGPALTLVNSTVISNTAGAGKGAVAGTGAITVRYNTFQANTAIHLTKANSAVGNIFAGTASQVLCQNVTSGDYNLFYPASATSCTSGAHNKTADPRLDRLRDNGGFTLTAYPQVGSAAIEGGEACTLDADQRGITRPFDSEGGGGALCDIGSVEAGSRTLRVCANCEPDPAQLRFDDLQAALDAAGTGDIIAVEAGQHTGSFIAYRDVTIKHAGFDMSKLHRDMPVDVRAILQASEYSVAQQRQLGVEGGSVLRTEGYLPTANTILPSSDVKVTLTDLTLRNGLALLGGAIFNRGDLTIERCTIADNAARDTWNTPPVGAPTVAAAAAGGGIYSLGPLSVSWSTLSGNVSESRGGALAFGGALTNAGAPISQRAYLTNSTLANNKAARLPDTYLVGVLDAGFDPSTLPVLSEDWVRFENRTSGQPVTLSIQPGPGVTCDPPRQLSVPVMGAGPSAPLICKGAEKSKSYTVTVTDGSTDTRRSMTITIAVPNMDLVGNTVYVDNYADVQLTRSLLYDAKSESKNCELRQDNTRATLTSGGYNLEDDTSCVNHSTDLVVDSQGNSPFKLSALQDNNWIDFDRQLISGYTDSHALLPGNPGIDMIPQSECASGDAGELRTIDLSVQGSSLQVNSGDVVAWQNTASTTVALNDGQAGVMLIPVPAGPKGSQPVQFVSQPGYESTTYWYRTYDAGGRQTSSRSVVVKRVDRPTDQRGMLLPQRGAKDYKCDVGAVEYRPWVVGEALLRPPSAVGTDPPTWKVDSAQMTDYDGWSGADSLDIAIHPTPLYDDGNLDPGEWAQVLWDLDPSPSATKFMTQTATVEWPDAPQVHVAGAPVTLSHDKITDGYAPTSARAFEGRVPADQTPAILTSNVFTRGLAASGATTYSVIQLSKRTNNNTQTKALVVRTYDWTTAGIRDYRDRNPSDGYTSTDCILGSELLYPAYDGLQGHSDPEGKTGQVLFGTAYDGVRTSAELATVVNTVDGLLPPAYVQETRSGPILPVLSAAPTTGPDDLDVAWYRPDSRQVAWPVKSAGYRCQWPAQPPQIVIASELGSEIGNQEVLASAHYLSPTVYSQENPDWPGYSPNYEHALLAASNLGNSAPALYALRTDLADRNTGTPRNSYALLKFQDANQANRIQLRAYSVVLTRTVSALPYTPVNGKIAPAAAAPATAAPATAANTTLKIGTGVLSNNGTATIPVDALGATGLRSTLLEITYDTSRLTPVKCLPNHNLLAERPYAVTLKADNNVLAKRVVHFRAEVASGTDLRYKWLFGDEDPGASGQFGDSEMSHVYETAKDYTVTVTVSNPMFPDAADAIVGTVVVRVMDPDHPTAAFQPLPAEENPTGCRMAADGKLVLDLRTLSKHGRSGDFRLADLTFARPKGYLSGDATVAWGAVNLRDADYTQLKFALTAGNPVYAPTPLRGLLDIQPCQATQASPGSNGKMPDPFWKDWKGMLWTRAAGDMTMNYFYPLQPGFYVSDQYVTDHGLPSEEAKRVGKCVPWLDNLPATDYPGGTKPTQIEYTGADGKTYHDSVYPTYYAASWPTTPGLLNVGETVYERAKGGVSAVASQVAVSRIYDDLSKGEWDNQAGRVELTGKEASVYLTSLIDPLAEVKVELEYEGPDGVPALPANIQTQRLLSGAGLGILGNTDPNEALPFSLRSRVVFRDAPEDVDGDGVKNGVLVFKGYYDGASPEYTKGDPLLLLNVMAESDENRLTELCMNEGALESAAGCDQFVEAVEALYQKTQNPRQLDLCRNAAGELFQGDPDKAHQLAWDGGGASSKMNECASVSGAAYWRDGEPDEALLIAVQDENRDGIPEPFEGQGKGKALTAGNAAGTGYVTLVYNNDASLGALPVSLQVVKVECARNESNEESPYRGNLLVINSDNLFDEKLTLRHTGDFGGRPDVYEFEWWIAASDETAVSPTVLPPSYPWQAWTRVEPGMSKLGPEITIEGANPTTLRDNWVIVRYRNTRCPVCGNQWRYSAFAGDPSAKPSEVKGQLAEGWIKRVVDALNPFDTRVDDFVSSPVATNVDMIRQAGPRYEGPVALNSDPENLNNMGLIEAYQTVLDRGRALSIDSNVNDQGANAALLNVTTRIAELYMLLGNDAYNDALDPIVGFDQASLGMRAPAMFAFANQFRADQFGPIDEELALLRGRDETLGGVAAAPTYNRLTWNFTNGDGEVAYVLNYNVDDINLDGYINEKDAQIMYPQGHGDAYGQQLTALTLYYQLLRHPNYTWVPRGESIMVSGAPVVVDYYDERRFAAAAAARAKMGAEIVDLAYHKNYSEPTVQPYRDPYVDPSDKCKTSDAPGCNKRAWGVADWAGRAGEGAYLDWLVANAIVPAVDDRYSDVRKIDRTTIQDLAGISVQLTQIQSELDRADQGVNPLGLNGDAVLFDLDPALTKTTAGQEGKTHFEQVYDKSIDALSNSLKMFAFANEAKAAQRQGQDGQQTFAANMLAEDRAKVNELIEIFGYPYDKDIGVNGTYPVGYDGPDIYNYNLIERTDLTDKEARCGTLSGTEGCRATTETELVEFPRMECLGHYVESLTDSNTQICEAETGEPTELGVKYEVGIGLDEGRGRYLPEAWSGASRRAWGDIQNKLWTVYDKRVAFEQAIEAYENQVEEIEEGTVALEDYAAFVDAKRGLKKQERIALDTLDSTIFVTKEGIRIAKGIAAIVEETSHEAADCSITFVGLAVDVASPGKCVIKLAGSATATAIKEIAEQFEGIVDLSELGKEVTERQFEKELFDKESDYELAQKGRELQGQIRKERELRLALFLAADNFSGAQLDYDAAVEKGFRKLNELILMRKRWAGQVMAARYNDMAYRMAENDALAKYREQFKVAQLYTYMTAAAYDYETNLQGDDPAAGKKLLRGIAETRTLGEMRWPNGVWTAEPIVGSGGLSDILGRLRDNFKVLKGQMGFNNPQSQTSRFSLRQELFRLRDTSDAAWRATLQRYYMPDIYANDVVGQLAKRPYGANGPQPGLVIPFASIIQQGRNFFDLPLGPGDGAYNPTQFATKIASVGVWFEGYDTQRLARMPYVYLLPGAEDVLRPRNVEGKLRYWNVSEQLLPLPYPLTDADIADPTWIPGMDGLQGRMYQNKPYAAFQAFPYTANLAANEMNTDTRLIGRSVWNSQWVLVIPGANLLADPELGIDRFMEDVDDIYVYFQTYAYAGASAALADAAPSEEAADTEVEAETVAAPSVAPKPMPQPDALFYGVAMRDGKALTGGTLTAILPRLGTVSAAIGPITGTPYNYEIAIPLDTYDPGDTNFAMTSARVGETIRFTIDGVPALLRDTAGVGYQAYGIDFAGGGYSLTVDVSGPGSYPPGDVNVSGKRDSADALMVLKYDVGLALGVTSWPPGPNTVYLPLCDVTQDGACNSTDALRILMCDVKLASCPGSATSGAANMAAPAGDVNPANPVYFKVEETVDATAGELVVRVNAQSPYVPLAVAALNIGFDPARLAVTSCTENVAAAAARMDLAVCNPDYDTGLVRFTGVTAAGITASDALVEVRLRALDPAVLEQAARGEALVELSEVSAFDSEGAALAPVLGNPEKPATDPTKMFLPLILYQTAAAGAEPAPIDAIPAPAPELPAKGDANILNDPAGLPQVPAR